MKYTLINNINDQKIRKCSIGELPLDSSIYTGGYAGILSQSTFRLLCSRKVSRELHSHSTLHNIYHVRGGFYKIRDIRYLHILTKFTMLTSYLERGHDEVNYEGIQGFQILSSTTTRLLSIIFTGGFNYGTRGCTLFQAYPGAIAEGDECGSTGANALDVWRGFIQAVAGESGNWQQVLGYRSAHGYPFGYGAGEQLRFYDTLQQFHDIFNKEGCSKNEGEAGAYAAGYAGGALCECGIGGAEVEEEEYSDGDVGR